MVAGSIRTIAVTAPSFGIECTETLSLFGLAPKSSKLSARSRESGRSVDFQG